MSAITVGGDLVHYEVLGRGGRPVILAHGWLGSWRYWIPTMRQLQLKYRVYALDLFGFGDSSKNPARYGIEHQILLMDEFMRQLAIPKAALIGHGLGAQIMTEFAARYPDRVARMLIAGAPIFSVPDLETRKPQFMTPTARAKGSDEESDDGDGSQQPLADRSTLDRDQVKDSAPDVEDPSLPDILAARGDLRTGEAGGAEKSREVAQPSLLVRSEARPAPAAEPVLIEQFSGPNPLPGVLAGSLESLLIRCFRRSEPEYDKLFADVMRSDSAVITTTAREYDAGRMLDQLKILDMPIVVVHGTDDPLIRLPDEEVWNYLTGDKEDKLLPIPLPNVRHFPMLEGESFQRLLGAFLETPDISKIEIRERWRRRSR